MPDTTSAAENGRAREVLSGIKCLPEVRAEAVALAAQALELDRELRRLAERHEELSRQVDALVDDGGGFAFPPKIVDSLRAELRAEHGTELLFDALLCAGGAVQDVIGAGTSVRPFVPEELVERLALFGPAPQPAGACSCDWWDEKFHDRLVALEDLPVGQAITEILLLATGDSDEHMDRDGFVAFIAAHNWRDPAGMAEAASLVENVAEAWQQWQAWRRTAGQDVGKGNPTMDRTALQMIAAGVVRALGPEHMQDVLERHERPRAS